MTCAPWLSNQKQISSPGLCSVPPSLSSVQYSLTTEVYLQLLFFYIECLFLLLNRKNYCNNLTYWQKITVIPKPNSEKKLLTNPGWQTHLTCPSVKIDWKSLLVPLFLNERPKQQNRNFYYLFSFDLVSHFTFILSPYPSSLDFWNT